jgi:release factor glutamine methyltransferase
MTGSFSSVTDRLRAAGCVFAEEEAGLLIAAANTPGDLDTLVARRVDGLPLEQVLGWAKFCNLRIEIDPGVFVPRQRSELLVREAAELTRVGAVVVDLCCGSGALGMAVESVVSCIELHSSDLDPAAVACARRNLEPSGRVYEGDLFDPLPASLLGRVELLLCNTPYVPTEEIAFLPAEARDHEPRLSLDGGPDGLDVQRRVAAEASRWLAPGGHLLVEATERQAPMTAAIFTANGLTVRVATSEELDATVVIGTKS